MNRIITLTSDFGLRDPWVGAMKGVILSIVHGARMVDITHEIAPGAILDASFVIGEVFDTYPEGTVHLVVVDPGVGTERRGIVIEAAGRIFIGPDNGVFSSIINLPEFSQAIHLTNEKFFRHPVSTTFHGRDVFAPVAAHIINGIALSELGEPIDDPVTIEKAKTVTEDGVIKGEVVYVDRFGNLITNISRKELAELGTDAELTISIKGHVIDGILPSYGHGAKALIALINSGARLEIAINEESASEAIYSGEGTPVEVRIRREVE
ncbi:MAG: SAM-dependent chlorinase/fluorinase [Deltaproteobacteria bacterium]|nr:SAM-dependent chlorinase/fluorinase [Deltaproteobacteria bacterium]